MYNYPMQNLNDLCAEIGRILTEKDFFLATAESCTGGRIGDLITSVPGSSDYYLGGFISYSNAAKTRWLGVPPETLERHGAVSRETVLAMAEGARRAFGDATPAERIISISVSGIAGPDGGTPRKPVGTVWIAVSGAGGTRADHYLFEGCRREIKTESAQQALENLLTYLRE